MLAIQSVEAERGHTCVLQCERARVRTCFRVFAPSDPRQTRQESRNGTRQRRLHLPLSLPASLSTSPPSMVTRVTFFLAPRTLPTPTAPGEPALLRINSTLVLGAAFHEWGNSRFIAVVPDVRVPDFTAQSSAVLVAVTVWRARYVGEGGGGGLKRRVEVVHLWGTVVGGGEFGRQCGMRWWFGSV